MDDRRTPIFLLAAWRDAQRDPGCGAHAEKETDNSRGNVAKSDPGERPYGRARGALRRERGAKAGKRRFFDERVERSGNRRSRLSQRFVTLAQRLIRRQARQQARSRVFIEFVVDQRDNFRVFIGHRTRLFQFCQRHARCGEAAHYGIDRNLQRLCCFCVAVPLAIDQKDRFAMSLGQAADRF